MIKKSKSTESKLDANPSITVVNDDTVKQVDNDNGESFICPLIEPIVAVSADKPAVVSSPPLPIAQRFAGILYALLAAVFYTSSMFIAKQLNIDLLDALIPRFLIQTIIIIVYMKLIKHYSLYKQCKKKEILLLITNAFFSTTGFLAFFLGYRYISLPDLTTIRYTQVIWTAILTAIIYWEKPSIPIILAVILTTIGVTCVAQPDFLFSKTFNITKTKENTNHQRLFGLLFTLYSSVAISITLISNRELLIKYKTKHSLIQLQFAFLSSCVVIGNLFYKYYFVNDKFQSIKNDFWNWKYLVASSICLTQIVSSVLTQKSLKRENPSIFTIVQSSDILFSILLQNIFTSNKSNLISLFGSILVLTSVLITAGFKFLKERNRNM